MKQRIRDFFAKNGWIVCIVLAIILATGIICTIFDTFVVILYVLALPVIAILIHLLCRYRRYFTNIMLVVILVAIIIVGILVFRNGRDTNKDASVSQNVVVEQTKKEDNKTDATTPTVQPDAEVTSKPAPPKTTAVNTSSGKTTEKTTPGTTNPGTTTPGTTNPGTTTPGTTTPGTTNPGTTNPGATNPGTTTPPTTDPTPAPIKVTAKIAWGDYVQGSTEIFASVILSDVPKTGPVIVSNLEYKVQKISDKLYYVRITIAEGSHGTAAIEVSGDGIEKIEKTLAY